MSRENVDRFRAAPELLTRGDMEAWLEAYDASAVFEAQITAMEGPAVGRENSGPS